MGNLSTTTNDKKVVQLTEAKRKRGVRTRRSDLQVHVDIGGLVFHDVSFLEGLIKGFSAKTHKNIALRAEREIKNNSHPEDVEEVETFKMIRLMHSYWPLQNSRAQVASHHIASVRESAHRYA